MTDEEQGQQQPDRARVIVEYRSSTQRTGQESYRVLVTSDATEEDVERTLRLASMARGNALAELVMGIPT